MNRELKRIEYCSEMIEKGMKSKDLPFKIWNGIQISDEVGKAVADEDLKNLGGVYGDRTAGDPLEYDHLALVYEGGETIEITVFNRGIALFITDDDRIRRIHRVLCKLAKENPILGAGGGGVE